MGTHIIFFPCTERRVCVCLLAFVHLFRLESVHQTLYARFCKAYSFKHCSFSGNKWLLTLSARRFHNDSRHPIEQLFFLSRTLLLCKMRAYACYSFQVLYSTSWRRKKLTWKSIQRWQSIRKTNTLQMEKMEHSGGKCGTNLQNEIQKWLNIAFLLFMSIYYQ